jgi:HPt (histidine-containing phosphotransfer) domain-containing protein
MQVREVASPEVERVARAPSLVPERPVIDFAHLTQMTGGDRVTMREVLGLFDLQSDLLLSRIMSEAPKAAAARAHTLADSAKSVGASRVAEAASELEALALKPGPVMLSAAVGRLASAVIEAQAEVDSYIRS